MLFFTLISNKVQYMMTPEVMTATARPGELGYTINARGVYRDGAVTFPLDLAKEAYITEGGTVALRFANAEEEFEAEVVQKAFNEDEQVVTFTAALGDGADALYDGQNAEVSFYYLKDYYPVVLPRSAVIYEGGGAFVYVVQTVSSVFGERQLAVSREVTVLDEDDFNAAVSGGISETDYVVYASLKPLRNEAAVRVVQ